MRQMMRRLARVADSSSSSSSSSSGSAALEFDGTSRRAGKEEQRRRAATPAAEGHVPVCVGEEMERFEVRAELLGRPCFSALLRRSAQEYGYEQRGVLRIPCPALLFRRLLSAPESAEAELLRALRDAGLLFDGEDDLQSHN